MDIEPIPPQPTRVKLIFNPISGAPTDSPAQLLQIIDTMQSHGLIPEVYLVEPGSDLVTVVRDAYRRGYRLFAASGGDGTVDTVARALAGSHAELGVIPTGTQNNVALSLNIPNDVTAAVDLLRTGRRIKVDLGLVKCGDMVRPFLEICSVGLLSALFPAADEIQRGNLARIGDLLATLVNFPPAEIHLKLDGREEVFAQGHVALVSNMPFVGPHYPIAPNGQYDDGLLDVLVFANLSKLDLVSSVVQTVTGGLEDARIKRYQVHSVSINTDPPMPILADGFPIGEGALHIRVQRRALMMIAGEPNRPVNGALPAGPEPPGP